MLGQALRRATRPAAAAVGSSRSDAGPAPRVDLTRCDVGTRDRLRRLSAASGAFAITDATAAAREQATVTVVTLTGDPSDGEVVAQLRREHRADPERRTVVIGRGTTWFDAAFGAGIDVWVDHSAEDDTVLSAIVGPRAS